MPSKRAVSPLVGAPVVGHTVYDVQNPQYGAAKGFGQRACQCDTGAVVSDVPVGDGLQQGVGQPYGQKLLGKSRKGGAPHPSTGGEVA